MIWSNSLLKQAYLQQVALQWHLGKGANWHRPKTMSGSILDSRNHEPEELAEYLDCLVHQESQPEGRFARSNLKPSEDNVRSGLHTVSMDEAYP